MSIIGEGINKIKILIIKESFWGFVFSSVVLAVLFWVLIDHYFSLSGSESNIRYMRPNELGDTLAGFAGVLAFFWLVLGYYQQGKELRETRKEVSMQREALDSQAIALADHVTQAALDNFVQILPLKTERLDDFAVRISIALNESTVSREKAAKYNTSLVELSFDYLINNISHVGFLERYGQASSVNQERIRTNISNFLKEYNQIVDELSRIPKNEMLLGTIYRSKYGAVYDILFGKMRDLT